MQGGDVNDNPFDFDLWTDGTMEVNMQDVKLKPCPFCGGEITLWDYKFGTVKVFECKACRTRFIFPWDKDVSEWNKRVEQEK